MADIDWDAAAAKFGGTDAVAVDWDKEAKKFGGKDVAPTASAGDRAQAAAAGVNRGVLSTGLGAPVDAALNVWDLLKAGYGTVGRQFGMKPENMPELTDRARIPGSADWLANHERDVGLGVDPNRPDDTRSRILFGGGNAIGSSMLLGGPRAAKPYAPVPANLQPGTMRGLLSSEPSLFAKDMAMAGTSGAVGQAATEMGFGPAGSILASFGPQVATQAIPMTVRGLARGNDSAGMQERIRQLREAGIDAPSAGLASGNGRLTWIDSLLSKLPGSSGVYAKSGEGVQRGMQERVNEIRDETSPNSTPLTAGQAFQDAVLGSGGYRDKFNRIYDKKDTFASSFIDPAMLYPATHTMAAANAITAPIPGAPNISALLQTQRMPGIRDAFSADALNGLPYAGIRGVSTKIGKEAASNAIIGTPEQGDWKTLYKALAQDKEAAAAASGDPRALPALKDANAFYASGRKQIDRLAPFVGKSGEPIPPELTFGRIESAIKNTPSLAESILGSVRGDVRNAQAATIVDRLGRATAGNQNDVGDVFSSRTFLTNWNRMSDGGKNAIFGPSTSLRGNLDAVAKAADMVDRSAKVNANPSGSAITGANMATLGTAASSVVGGVASGHPVAGLTGAAVVGALVTGNYLTAKMLTSPVVVNWLAQATKLPANRVPQTLGRLAANSAGIKDPETRADTQDFIRRLTEQQPQY